LERKGKRWAGPGVLRPGRNVRGARLNSEVCIYKKARKRVTSLQRLTVLLTTCLLMRTRQWL
jgi:hypothetical protein